MALSVVKKYSETLSIGLSWRFSPKSVFGVQKGAIDSGNLFMESSLRYHMCDPYTKFEEDSTKVVVAIVDERFVRTHTDRHTAVQSSDFISVQCHELQ